MQMNRTVLINRLKLAASLIGSRHSLSQRRGYSRLISIMDDLKQYKFPFACEPVDYNVVNTVENLSRIIKEDRLDYKVLYFEIIKPLEESWQSQH